MIPRELEAEGYSPLLEIASVLVIPHIFFRQLCRMPSDAMLTGLSMVVDHLLLSKAAKLAIY